MAAVLSDLQKMWLYARALEEQNKAVSSKRYKLLPKQIYPPGDWRWWLFQGGRGSGKTFCGSYWTNEYMRLAGPDAIAIVIGKTIGNTYAVCIDGPSGLYTLFKDDYSYINRSSSPGKMKHKNGGVVLIFGADEPTRLDGPECGWMWGDEIAVWLEATWLTAQFCLRRGKHPRGILTTTPKARKFVAEISKRPTTKTTVSSMHDNPHTAQSFRDDIQREYGGTRLGRQEIEGLYVEELDGAMFKLNWIEDNRVRPTEIDGKQIYKPPVDLVRVVVAIDPAGNHKPDNAETGITVAGLGTDGEEYVLENEGLRVSPNSWAMRAIELYDKWSADCLVGETNYGGEMVENTIRQAARRPDGSARKDLVFKMVTATRGKAIRAEPIAARYEQGHVHHVGYFNDVEDQMISFPVDAEKLKDRLDSNVWALTELMTGQATKPHTFRIARVG